MKSLKSMKVHLTEALLDGIEVLVNAGGHPTRSEAIRFAIRCLLKDGLWTINKDCDRGCQVHCGYESDYCSDSSSDNPCESCKLNEKLHSAAS